MDVMTIKFSEMEKPCRNNVRMVRIIEDLFRIVYDVASQISVFQELMTK